MNIEKIPYDKVTTVTGRLNTQAKNRIKILFKTVLQDLIADAHTIPEIRALCSASADTLTCTLCQPEMGKTSFNFIPVNSIDGLSIFCFNRGTKIDPLLSLRATLQLDHIVEQADPNLAFAVQKFISDKNAETFSSRVHSFNYGLRNETLVATTGVIKYDAEEDYSRFDNYTHVYFRADLQIILDKDLDFDPKTLSI